MSLTFFAFTQQGQSSGNVTTGAPRLTLSLHRLSISFLSCSVHPPVTRLREVKSVHASKMTTIANFPNVILLLLCQGSLVMNKDMEDNAAYLSRTPTHKHPFK